ncbi:MAG: SHOCT domain-containing protein [Actinomycetota bacterium]|nr:SHOCT domain-containing protein [Actinomycetota bacterium]
MVSMMWYWGGGVHWWGWLLGALGMVAFWGLVVWAIWYLVTALARPQHGQRAGDAKMILDERLARGEIDVAEYQRLRDLLAGNDVGSTGPQPPVGTGGGPSW